MPNILNDIIRAMMFLKEAKRKIIQVMLLILFFLVISNNARSQNYIPFPQDSAVWYSVYSYPWPHPPWVYYYTYQYEAKGDTIINDIGYIKFYSCDALEDDTCLSYRGSYRVDAASTRVYYLDKSDTVETLVYDFMLNPGDSIIMRGSSFVCMDTGLVAMNDGSIHKYQTMLVPENDNCIQTWITGIGSLGMPLLEPYWGCAYTFESRYDLTCFFYKGEQIYEWLENPVFEGCAGTNVGIKENSDDNSFFISPNPVSSNSVLVCFNSNPTLYDYQIYNINGYIIQSESDIRLEDIIISKNNYANGLYLFLLYSQNQKQFSTIKFVVN